MILHQDNQFIYNGIASLHFPEVMRLESENRTATEDKFQLISPDGKLRLCIEFFSSSKSAKELIEELNDPEEHEIIFPIRAIKTPTGVRGYVITYAVGNDRYEEGTLNLGGDARFNYWLWQERGNPCDYSLFEQVKSDLLDNIKFFC